MKDETIKDIIFAIAMVLCLILMAIQYVDSSPRRRFRDRAELSPDEFYQQYYESSGLPKDLVIETLNLISTEISIPATLLRPTDIFAELDISALDCAELAIKLDDLIKEKGSNYKTDDLLTIDACIRCVVDLRQMESKPDNTAKCNPKYDTIPESDSINPLIVIAAIVVYIILQFFTKSNILAACILMILMICYYVIKKTRSTDRRG